MTVGTVGAVGSRTAVLLAELAPRRSAAATVLVRPGVVKTGSVLLFLAVWELLGRHVDPILLSYPTAILRAFPVLIASGELTRHAGSSLLSFLGGFGLAVAVGIPVGLLMGRYRLAEYALDWHVHALYATPRVATIPLLVLWLGLGTAVKIAIVFLTAVFPIVLATYRGARSVGPHFTETALAYGAGPLQVFVKVFLPATFPYVVAGVRLGIGRGIIGITLAELFTAVSGLGYLLVAYANSFATDRLFVPVVVLAGFGVALTEGLGWLQRRLAPWKETERILE
ncbi:MAG: ABC transporter permease [Candidatus Rokuibacteriota bacterium]